MTTTSHIDHRATLSHQGPVELLGKGRRKKSTQSGLSATQDAIPARLPVQTGSQGEMEAEVAAGMTRFQHEYLSRGSEGIRVHLIADLLVVRLTGVLTLPERRLVNASDPVTGCNLVKQMRTRLIESGRPVLETMIETVTGVRVLSLHHDLSTVTGEEFILFTLAKAPALRDGMNKRK